MELISERIKNIGKLRVYMLVESTAPDLSKEISEFMSEALTKPIEVKSGSVNIALTFLWSLVNRVAKHLEDAGKEVLDIEFSRGRTVIVTKRGYVINIVVRQRQNQYVAEIEGVVDVEESPFKVEDF